MIHRLIILCSIFILYAPLIAVEVEAEAARQAEKKPQSNQPATTILPQEPSLERTHADERADELMKKLAEQRRGPDAETLKLVQEAELLLRKAEAYILVEQPLDAGRVLASAQLLLKELTPQQQQAARAHISAMSQRMYVVAQALFAQNENMPLDTEKDKESAEVGVPILKKNTMPAHSQGKKTKSIQNVSNDTEKP